MLTLRNNRPTLHAATLTLFTLVSCADDGKPEPYGNSESTVAAVGSDTGIPPFCNDMRVEANGTDIDATPDPRVGETWQLRMFCHDSLMTGANILQFAPPSRATVAAEMTDATFMESGPTSMLLQSGNIQYRTDLTVLPAE